MAEFDLVLIETLWGHAFAVAAEECLAARVPYVVQLHGQLMPWALRHKYWKKRIHLGLLGADYLNTAAALQCTDSTEADAAARLNLRAPTFIVPNGIDAAVYLHMPMRGAMRQRFQIPEGAKLLLFLGRLNRIKRPDIAIDVVASLRSTDHDVHLVLAGPDEDGLIPALRAQAQSLDCDNRVHFTGLLSTSEVLQALADADLLLMPSAVQENFGMVALEAMAAGVPLIVSDSVPIARWAHSAQAGRMVECNTVSFVNLALDLLSQPAELKRMGQRGRELVQQRFDIRIVSQQLLTQFESIVQSGRKADVTPGVA